MASDGRNLAVDGLPNDDDDDEADLNTANGYANDDGLQDMASFPLEDEGDLSPAIDHQDGRNDLDAAAMQQSPDGGRADNAGNLIVGLNEDVYDGDVEDMEHESSSDYTSDELSTGDMDEMDASFHVGGGRVANPDARDGQRDQADEGDDQAGTKAVACVYCLVDDADKEVVFVDLKLPCRHWACFECLNTAARQALVTRIAYPPQCCCDGDDTDINLKALEEHLLPDNRARLLACLDEFTSDNPTWCFHPKCSAFLRVDDGNQGDQFLACQKCGEQTCTKCKALKTAHASPQTCPDLLSAQDKALMATENWKQCPNENCRKVIDRSHGCNIMTCHCGTIFCWLCLQIMDASQPSPSCKCFEDEQSESSEELADLEVSTEHGMDDRVADTN